MTRDEYLDWCRKRALEHLDAGDLTHAVASMASDLKTHPDTDNPAHKSTKSIAPAPLPNIQPSPEVTDN